jgi:hypothetical protein
MRAILHIIARKECAAEKQGQPVDRAIRCFGQTPDARNAFLQACLQASRNEFPIYLASVYCPDTGAQYRKPHLMQDVYKQILDPLWFWSDYLRSAYADVFSVLVYFVICVVASVAYMRPCLLVKVICCLSGAQLLAPSLIATLFPCRTTLARFLPPLRGYRGRSPPGVRRGSRFDFVCNNRYIVLYRSIAVPMHLL